MAFTSGLCHFTETFSGVPPMFIVIRLLDFFSRQALLSFMSSPFNPFINLMARLAVILGAQYTLITRRAIHI